MNKTKTLATLAVFFFLFSTALAVKLVGQYSDENILATSTYVIRSPEDLSQQATINNYYSIALAPTIMVNQLPTASTAPIFNPDDLKTEVSRFALEKPSDTENARIVQRIEFKENEITSTLSIKNTGTQ